MFAGCIFRRGHRRQGRRSWFAASAAARNDWSEPERHIRNRDEREQKLGQPTYRDNPIPNAAARRLIANVLQQEVGWDPPHYYTVIVLRSGSPGDVVPAQSISFRVHSFGSGLRPAAFTPAIVQISSPSPVSRIRTPRASGPWRQWPLASRRLPPETCSQAEVAAAGVRIKLQVAEQGDSATCDANSSPRIAYGRIQATFRAGAKPTGISAISFRDLISTTETLFVCSLAI